MKYKGYILLAITIVIFSTLEVVTSTLKGIIHPLQLTFVRFFIGGFTLLPFVIAKREKLDKKDWLFFLGLGLLNIFISMGALQLSISLGKASTAAILISSNPIFVMLFSAVILKEKATFDKIACIVLGMVGISLIIYKGNTGGDTAVSLILALLASFTFGLYTVLGKLKSEGVSSISMISISSILGSLFYIPVLLYYKLPLFYIPQTSILKVAYLGVFLSGIAYITYMEALKLLSASKGSMVFFLKPVLASTLAVIFLGESLSLKTAAGMLLVLAGIFINFVRINTKTKNSAEASTNH
ncbi:MAG: putative rane protein [Clostridia bacterium]|jgi:drug/metabolite transporter (DMT)-like permease|nr:putative rane protein [Clostridia bacterium]